MTLQEIASTITKVQSNMRSKVFQNSSQSTEEFENFGGSSVGCQKMRQWLRCEPRAKCEGRVLISNMNLAFWQQMQGSRSLFRFELRVRLPNTKVVFLFQMQTSIKVAFQYQCEPTSSVFQYQTQACELRVSNQREIHIFSVIDSHKTNPH